MVTRIACFFLLILIPGFLWSQTIDQDYVIQENKKAAELNRQGKFEQANDKLTKLLVQLEAASADERYFATTYQTKAKIVQNLGNYEESTALARKSLLISLKKSDSANIADSYNTIGVNHYFEADYDSTTYYYEKSFEIKKRLDTEPYSIAVSAYNIALVYDDLGESEKAMDLYKEAESQLLISKRKESFLSDVYVGMALIYFYSGEVVKSEVYAEKALEMGLKYYGEFNPNMTFVYTTYANILESEEQYEEAIALLEKNLKIRKSTYGEFHRWTCETYYDLANSYVLVKQYDKAEEYYKRAIEIGSKINSRQYLANARNFLAQLYLNREIHLKEAEELLLLSLETNRLIYGDESDLVAENYVQLAKLYKITRNDKRFLESIENSLSAADYDSKDLSKLIGPIQALGSLVLLGDWHYETFEKTKDVKHLYRSYDLIDEKTSLIKHTQDNFSSDRLRIDFANKYREVFENELGLCWVLYYETRDKKYLQKAIELSETNRNTTLLKGLQGIKFRAYGDIPQEKLDLEEKTKKELERVKMDLFFEKTASKPDKSYYRSLLDERIVLSNKLDSIYKDFNRNYPKFKNFKTDENPIQVSEIQSQLDEDTQIINYFLGEETLYSLGITKDSITFLRADFADKIIEITNDFKSHLSKREDVDELSHDLYLYLLGQQMDRDKKNIVIIPDNVLNYIPFEVLKDANGNYIVENHNISYTGSTRLFLELNNEFFKYDSENDWAGFAPSYDGENQITSARNEIEDIGRLTNGMKFVGMGAKKDSFLFHNKDYSVLHLAMHAKIDHKNPLYNRLVFEDEELTASEIYTSRSKANLAVLSACNTGFGKLEKGEGVMSMARAFHFSGIPSIVMSLWKVPDKETKSIMTDFYRYLIKGKSKSEAMRLAKLSYLEKNRNSILTHPYYWSGFVINGNAEAIELGSSKYLNWLIVLTLIFMIFLGFVFKKRKT